MQYFLCDFTTSCEAYSFMTDGYEIFNVQTTLGACRTHEGGQAQTSLRKSWLEDRKTVTHPALPGEGDQTQGLWTLYHWATSPNFLYETHLFNNFFQWQERKNVSGFLGST